MWTPALTAILGLITQLAPALKVMGTAAQLAPLVEKTVSTLEIVLPVAVQFAKDQVAVIKNAIEDLRASGKVDPAQLDRLDAMAAVCDANYDEATADANVADAADDAAKKS